MATTTERKDIMNLKDINKDDILAALGLETKKTVTEYIVPALGVFAAGILVGAGFGILFAPKSGRDLRQDIGDRLDEFRDRANKGDVMGGGTTHSPTAQH